MKYLSLFRSHHLINLHLAYNVRRLTPGKIGLGVLRVSLLATGQRRCDQQREEDVNNVSHGVKMSSYILQ